MPSAGGLPNAVHCAVAAGCSVVKFGLTLPMALETPKRDEGDARNLATLRHLRQGSRRPR